jgi:hypothetical protein
MKRSALCSVITGEAGCLKSFQFARRLDVVNFTRNEKMKKVKSTVNIIRLPKQERDAILRTAAKKAEKDYLENPVLTSFDAIAEDDLYDETR